MGTGAPVILWVTLTGLKGNLMEAQTFAVILTETSTGTVAGTTFLVTTQSGL